MSTEFKVGLFSTLALMVLGYIFLVLNPSSFFSSQRSMNYYTQVKDAAGIVLKTQVKTNGVIIGQVRGVTLDMNSTRIDFSVDAEVKIPKGSQVAIREKGLLGDVFLEVLRGDDQADLHEEGDFVAPVPDQVTISTLVNLAGSIGKDIKKITVSLSRVLGGEVGEETMASIVADLKEIAHNAKVILRDNRDDVRSIVANLENSTNSLKAAIGDEQGRQNLKEIVHNLGAAMADFREFSSSMKQVLNDENREKIEKILARFDSTMGDVESTAKNVRLVAERIERGDGTIGKLINNDETIQEFDAAVKDIRAVLAPATKLETIVDGHSEFRKDGTSQHHFNVQFRTRPDKFYLLGFTDVTESVRETVVEDLPSGSNSPGGINAKKTRERTYERSSIRFNVQFGKRFLFAQFRLGLFETTGGLATDFFAFDDRVRLSFEAFDFKRDSYYRKTAHYKAYLSILFFKHIYAMIGIDDPTRIDYDTGKTKPINYFAGAGLSFDDKDLKAIFGTAALAR